MIMSFVIAHTQLPFLRFVYFALADHYFVESVFLLGAFKTATILLNRLDPDHPSKRRKFYVCFQLIHNYRF
jgi:hypothetical protein